MVGRTVYTDTGVASRKAVCVWYENGSSEKYIILEETGNSLQTLALSAVVWACQCWMHEPINLVSGSLYVVNVVKWIDDGLDTAH